MNTLQQVLKSVQSFLLEIRILLCIGLIHWLGALPTQATDTTWFHNGDGTWTTAAYWSNGVPIDATYNAFIDDGDTAVTVTLDASQTVNNLSIGSDDQLIIPNNRNLILSGDLSSGGILTILSSINLTDLVIEDTSTLSGGGEVVLSGNNDARILDESGDPNGHLINVDHTIHGLGRIGANRMQITNQTGGSIDADILGEELVIDPNEAGVTNMGNMAASSGGILHLKDGSFSNASGTIQAMDSSIVRLDELLIVGGTLTTTGSGVIETANANINMFEDLTINGWLRINNTDNIQLVGSINNKSTINIVSSGSPTDLLIETEVTLIGGGDVALIGNIDARICDDLGDPEGHLINVDNLIHGQGLIGNRRTQITNQADGTIDADVWNETLQIEPNAAGVTNSGMIKASGGGTLVLASGPFTNTLGTIHASDNSPVRLKAATIIGGMLATSGSGVIDTLDASLNILEDLTIDGSLRINNSGNVQLVGTIENLSGTIEIYSTGASTDLLIETEVTLTGGGEVILANNTDARIRDAGGDPTGHLINVNNTIHGQGNIGHGRTQITNKADGTIDANVAGRVLIISPNAAGVSNAGLIQASGGGTLKLLTGSFANTDGTIHAADSARIKLDGVSITGGTLNATGSGYFETETSNLNVLEDLTINGLVRINNADNLQLVGTIQNTNTIDIAPTSSLTDLAVESEVTLTGGGTIKLGDASDARILDQSGPVEGRLINEDNTIHGSGQIGADRMVEVVNNGTIAGNSSSDMISISVPLSGTGPLSNVLVSSRHAPGTSTAIIELGGLYKLTYFAQLDIDIGGTTPGTEHDQLDSDDLVLLGGTLNITRIDVGDGLFAPEIGDTFTIIQADTRVSRTFWKTNLEDTPRPIGAYEVLYEPTEVILRYGEADGDGDGDVDGNDFLVWQRGYGITGSATLADGDFNGDGNVNGYDLNIWKSAFGGIITAGSADQIAVPEPFAITSALILIGCLWIWRSRTIKNS